jgi:hypothetical protein
MAKIVDVKTSTDEYGQKHATVTTDDGQVRTGSSCFFKDESIAIQNAVTRVRNLEKK